MAKKPNKVYDQIERKSRISVSDLPEVTIDIMNIECKVVIDEEPAIYKFLQKQNIQNISKSMIGVVILKIPRKMVIISRFRNIIWSMQEVSAMESGSEKLSFALKAGRNIAFFVDKWR